MTDLQEITDRAGRLGLEIWLSLLPHAELPNPEGYRSDDNRPAEESRPVTVLSASQLRPGDLILALDGYAARTIEYNRLVLFGTIREAVQRHSSQLCRVEAVTASGIKVYQSLNAPTGYWQSCNPEQFGEPMAYDRKTVRYAIPTNDRMIIRLGNLDDILPRLRAHADYAAWVADYAASVKGQEEADAAHRAKVAERDAKRAPLVAAAEAFNVLTGETLVKISSGLYFNEVGEVSAADEWLAQGDRLRTYLVGLASRGKISQPDYLAALGHLRTLGLYDPKES